jgi:hypothetical protein
MELDAVTATVYFTRSSFEAVFLQPLLSPFPSQIGETGVGMNFNGMVSECALVISLVGWLEDIVYYM